MLPIKECTDTEDENVGHPTDVRTNESGMIADDETTVVENSDNEQCFSEWSCNTSVSVSVLYLFPQKSYD